MIGRMTPQERIRLAQKARKVSMRPGLTPERRQEMLNIASNMLKLNMAEAKRRNVMTMALIDEEPLRCVGDLGTHLAALREPPAETPLKPELISTAEQMIARKRRDKTK